MDIKKAAVIGSGVGWLWLHAFNVGASIDAGVGVLRDAGPWAFFTGMALLPAAGFPIVVFNLTAGTAFSEKMGLWGVLAAAGVAVAINLILT